ncbi:MAG TPA: hypothetical protein VG797_06755 [Phycisphaerales bacterium]|nr:hypothetical protein [Phycisphaerales bacterium]
MESSRHADLKRAALRFLIEHGCSAAATEVRCPLSRYRADAAGYMDVRRPTRDERQRSGTLWGGAAPSRPRREKIDPVTVVIECKQCRSDFLRETAERDRLIDERTRLTAEKSRIERDLIRHYEPHLQRSGSALFSELESWDFERSRLAAYREVVRALRRVEQGIHGDTKFFLMSQYRVADRLYLLTVPGLIKPREMPGGWGLLEWSSRRGAVPGPIGSVRQVIPAPERVSRPEVRSRLLRNIAVSLTFAALRETGPSNEVFTDIHRPSTQSALNSA